VGTRRASAEDEGGGVNTGRAAAQERASAHLLGKRGGFLERSRVHLPVAGHARIPRHLCIHEAQRMPSPGGEKNAVRRAFERQTRKRKDLRTNFLPRLAFAD
jgi:hypothetical protein